MRAYAVDPVASGEGFPLRYDYGVVGAILSDEPQLHAVNLVGSNGSQALNAYYLVDRIPQPDLPSVEEHVVTSGSLPSLGGRISNLVTFSESTMPLSFAFRWTPCSTTAELPAFSLTHLQRRRSLPLRLSPLVAATASPSPALLECLTPEQQAAFLRVWKRLPAQLCTVAFDLNGPDWITLAIEQLGNILCDFADVFSTSKTGFGSCSLMPSIFRSRNVARLSLPGPTGSTLVWAKKLTRPWGPVYRGWPDLALDHSVFEPAGCNLN